MPRAPVALAVDVDLALAPWLAKPCERHAKTNNYVPDPDAQRQGSSVALARERDRLVAYVTNPDRATIHVVDVGSREVVASAEVLGTPEQLQVLNDGRVVVSIGDRSHIEVFELKEGATKTLERRCARKLSALPFGLATSKDGLTLGVTTSAPATLTLFDVETFATPATVSLPRAPRGVLIDDSGRAFVTHLVGGRMSSLEIAFPERGATSIDMRLRTATQIGTLPDMELQREGTQAYALASVEITIKPGGERPPVAGSPAPALRAPVKEKTQRQSHLVVPMVSVDPGSTTRQTRYYYGPPPLAGVPKQAPTAVLVDADAQRAMSTRVLAPDAEEREGECFLPRALAFRRASRSLFVACVGLDRVLELDAGSADPMRSPKRSYDVPKGPTGIAIADPEQLMLVNSVFDGKLAIISLKSGIVDALDLDLGTPRIASNIRAGREMFFRTGDANITHEGLACASCHPDGNDDGVTWSTPEGPRQTPMLRGRLLDTAPYGWSRGERTLDSYVDDTMSRLGGNGLTPADREALVIYLKSMKAPPPAPASRLAAAGASIFMSARCESCHIGVTGTDRSTHADDVGKVAIDTPSLRSVAMTAPYFHDARYRSLEELLADQKSTMPGIAGLDRDQQVALAAFLRGL